MANAVSEWRELRCDRERGDSGSTHIVHQKSARPFHKKEIDPDDAPLAQIRARAAPGRHPGGLVITRSATRTHPPVPFPTPQLAAINRLEEVAS